MHSSTPNASLSLHPRSPTPKRRCRWPNVRIDRVSNVSHLSRRLGIQLFLYLTPTSSFT